MDMTLPSADLLLRGATAALLLFHLALILSSRLPRPHRWALAAFVASVLAYLLCSHPDFFAFHWLLRLPMLGLCMLTPLLLWLAMQFVFDDEFTWSARVGVLMALALGLVLALSALALTGVGGLPVTIGHKVLLIGIVIATLWTILKDWRSDLVPNRRVLRLWVPAGMGAYVLMVLSFELAFAAGPPPRWLEVLNLAGMVCLAGVLAFVNARHPLHEWLGSAALATVPTLATVPEAAPAPISAARDLTPPPLTLDRKAALRQRLVLAMGNQRAYASEGLTLAQLAEQLEATPVQLREVINQTLGYRNFNDFLHHYRVDEAAQRLLAQDLPILSIALDVGYGSIGPFNRAFKHIKGVTPSEFRAQKK